MQTRTARGKFFRETSVKKNLELRLFMYNFKIFLLIWKKNYSAFLSLGMSRHALYNYINIAKIKENWGKTMMNF